MVKTTQGERPVAYWIPELQDKAIISQVNPITTTEYAVLTAENARIIAMYGETTGGTVQQLRINTVCDGIDLDFVMINPISGTPYFAHIFSQYAMVGQMLGAANTDQYRAFLIEGREIVITAEVIWTVQPSPLQCEVIYQLY